ncbi:MAG: beta-propeller fold lactonase family protein [Phycisphaeraceae bacterium]|nr:beta-propeller fold lactonase family protein [Phycisphaeraceae bacterium]
MTTGLPAPRPLTLLLAAAALAAAPLSTASAQATFRAVFVGHYYFNSQTGAGGTVASLRVNPDGTLTLLGNADSGPWTQSLALSPSGRWLAAAAGTSATQFEEVRLFRVNADASLTLHHQALVPDSPLAMVWITDDLIAITATQLGGSSVGIYRWNPDAPSLLQRDRKSTGSFNSALAYHPSRPYLYTQNSQTSLEVRQWLISFDDATYGMLTDAGATPLAHYPLNIITTGTGEFMYAGGGISGDRHAILGFGLDTDGQPPVAIPGSPFTSPGNSPAYLASNGDDRFVLVGHGTDATLRSFEASSTGVLTSTGNSFLVQNLQGAIGEVASLRDLVFVTDDTSALDGVQGIYSLRLGPTGTLSPIGGLVYTGTPRPEGGIAVWNPTTVCPGDYNGNGEIDPVDLADFINAWTTGLTDGSLYADADGDRTHGPTDIAVFVQQWLSAVQNGC